MKYNYYKNKYGRIFRRGCDPNSEVYVLMGSVGMGETRWAKLGTKGFLPSIMKITEEEAFLMIL